MVKTQNIDVELLDEYIKKSGLRTEFIVNSLGISRQGFYKKRKGTTAFRGSEVYMLCDLLHIPEDVKPKIFCL